MTVSTSSVLLSILFGMACACKSRSADDKAPSKPSPREVEHEGPQESDAGPQEIDAGLNVCICGYGQSEGCSKTSCTPCKQIRDCPSDGICSHGKCEQGML